MNTCKSCKWWGVNLADAHPQSAFFPRLFQGLYWNIDGLPLYGLTESQLDDFLNRKTPFNACRICTGGRRSSTPWKEARNKYEWMEESTE